MPHEDVQLKFIRPDGRTDDVQFEEEEEEKNESI